MEFNNITIPQMLRKLDDMYIRQSKIIKEINILKLEWEQLEEDVALLQDMIIYKSNKINRQQ